MAALVETVVVWIQWTILILIALCCFYMVYRFVCNRNELQIQMRVPALTYIYCTSCLLMLFGRMFLDPHNCPFQYAQLKNDGSYTQSDIMQYINAISLAIRMILISTAFSMKLWYLYYMLKLQTLIINGKWWTQINENLNQNWWIKNAEKYGRTNKITWIVLFLWMFIMIMFAVIVGFKVNLHIPRMIGYVQLLIFAAASVIFYCKVPRINDIYGIKQEIKAITMVTLFAFFWFPITEFASGNSFLHIMYHMIYSDQGQTLFLYIILHLTVI